MGKNEFIVLGSSSGMPQANRACAGYALKVGVGLSVLDCGGGVCSSFLRSGLDPRDIERIFISHTHPDHCAELPLLIQMVYLTGRERPLDVFVPAEFADPLKACLLAMYLIPDKMPFDLRIVGYEPGKLHDGDYALEALANRHLHGYADLIERLNLPNQLRCHSFLITVNGKRLLYSADIADFADIQESLKGCDVAVIESTHVDLEPLLETARERPNCRFIITHLGSPEEVANLVTMIDKAAADNVVLAEDGLRLEF